MEPSRPQFTPLVTPDLRQEPEHTGGKKRIITIGVLLICLMILGVWLISSGKKTGLISTHNPTPTQGNIPLMSPLPLKTPTPTLIPHPVAGYFKLATKDGRNRYEKNSAITVVLTAGSENKQVVSYDVVLKYPVSGFAFQKAVSLNPDFQIFAQDNRGYISISGIKNLQSTSSSVWTNTPLIEYNFNVPQAGTYKLILQQVGKETNKMVDDKAFAVYPQTAQLELEIY